MERVTLVKTLELASRALADGNLVPIFKCFAFDAEKHTVTAYNDLIGIVAPCKVEESFCVDGGTLLGLLKHSRAETVEIAIEDQDVILKAARSTFKLPFFPLKDFLFEEPEDEWDSVLPIDADLLTGLTACLVTSSRDAATQPALVGISVEPGKGKNVILYSSDGDCISRYNLATKTASVGSVHMMPNAFCEALLALTQELEVTKGDLEINKDWARVTLSSGHVIYGRAIENDNPLDFAGQIKQTMAEEPEFIEAPKGLDHALSRARVVADPESAQTELTIEKGRLRLVTTTSMGIVRDTLAIAKHPDVEARISAALMQRSLSLCVELVVLDNCCAFRSDKLFVLTSNME